MLLSIIIPTLNSSATLNKTLQSIATQEFKDLEVVIIDGLSTDTTLEIIDTYAGKIRFTIISEKDPGIYDAMNKGVANAKGDWLYFLGSDDSLHDNEVLQNVFDITANEYDIIYGDIIWLPSGEKEQGYWDYHTFLQQNINHQRIFYKASLFKKQGGFDPQYKIAADHELNIRFFCNPAVKIKYVPVSIAHYYAFGYSANKIDESFWKNWKTIILKNFSLFLPEKEIYKRMSWYCWHKLNQKQYGKSLRLFLVIFFKTRSMSFLKHTLSQVAKVARN